MTLREDIDALFQRANDTYRAALPVPGGLPRLSGPTPSDVAINENFAALVDAVLLIADRIDALEGGATRLN